MLAGIRFDSISWIAGYNTNGKRGFKKQIEIAGIDGVILLDTAQKLEATDCNTIVKSSDTG